MESNGGPTLSKQTGVTIGLAVIVMGASVSAAWWFGNWTGSDSAWKAQTDLRLEAIEDALRAPRWSVVDMTRWTSRLREANEAGSLKVPEPYTEKE